MARLLETEPVIIDDDFVCREEEGLGAFMNLKEPTRTTPPELSVKEDRRFFTRKRQIDEDEALARRLQREVDRHVIDVDDNDSDVEYLYSRPPNPVRFPSAKRRLEDWPTLPTLSSLSSMSSAHPTLPTLHPPFFPSVPTCSPVFHPSEHTPTQTHSGFPLGATSSSIPSTTTTTTTTTSPASSFFPSSINTFPPLPSLPSISVSIQALPAANQAQRSISPFSPSQPHNHSHVHVHLHPRPIASQSPRLPSFHEFELHERAAEQLVMEANNSTKNHLNHLVTDLDLRKADMQPYSLTSRSSLPGSSPLFSNSTLSPLSLFPSIGSHSNFVPSPSLFHAHVHSHAQALAHSQLPHHHHSAPFLPHQPLYPHSHHFSSLPSNHPFRSFLPGNLGPLSHVTTLELVCSPFGSIGDEEDETDNDAENYDTEASDLDDDDDDEDYFASTFDHPHYAPFRGADEKTILNIPVSSYEVKDVNNVDICSICIEEFCEGIQVKRMVVASFCSSIIVFLLFLQISFSSSKITLSLQSTQKYDEVELNRHLRAVNQGAKENIQLFKTQTEHSIVIQVGSPPTSVNVVVDTASVQLAVPLEGCKCSSNCQCGKQIGMGNLQSIACDSSLCSKRSCSNRDASLCAFAVNYADGSAISGILVTGKVGIGKTSLNVSFGGLYEISARFASVGADGVLGLAPGGSSISCSPNCVKPFFDSLVEATQMRNIFSINMTTNGNGTITFGGMEDGVSASSIVYTPIVPSAFYAVTLEKLMIGEIVLLSTSVKVTVDSGSTYLVLPYDMLTNLKNSLSNNFSLPYAKTLFQPEFNGCFPDNGTLQLDKWPNLKIALTGVQLELSPKHYFTSLLRDGQQSLCFTVVSLGNQNNSNILLGGSIFSAYYTIFDRENKQIGFSAKSGTVPAKNTSSPPPPSGLSDNQKAAVGIMVILLAAIIIGGAIFLFVKHRSAGSSYKKISPTTQIVYD